MAQGEIETIQLREREPQYGQGRGSYNITNGETIRPRKRQRKYGPGSGEDNTAQGEGATILPGYRE